MHLAAPCRWVPLTFTLGRKMKRSARVVFLSLCATVVSVAIWSVALLLNLLQWIFGDVPYLREIGWAAVLVSALAFWAVFYRHFNRVVPVGNSFE